MATGMAVLVLVLLVLVLLVLLVPLQPDHCLALYHLAHDHLAHDRRLASQCHGMADHVALALYRLLPRQYSRQPQDA
jgi:hypothetical protein